MDENPPDDRLRSLEERVLMLEAGHKAPLSTADRWIAEALDKRKWAPHRDTRAPAGDIQAGAGRCRTHRFP
jgi:hypothetical protein